MIRNDLLFDVMEAGALAEFERSNGTFTQIVGRHKGRIEQRAGAES
nr:hypothetical protein [Pseudomonas viridiflava]